ncbi:MAG: glycosyltransferase family 4 protein [Coxiellaceae bacterium]|nr:glycosyltransferase family 4 protein [Coxiellaceae bacterium]
MSKSLFIHTAQSLDVPQLYSKELSHLAHGDEKRLLAVVVYQPNQTITNAYDVVCQLTDDVEQLENGLSNNGQAASFVCTDLNNLLRVMAQKAEYLYCAEAGQQMVGDSLSGLLAPLQQDPMLAIAIPREYSAQSAPILEDQVLFNTFKQAAMPHFLRAYTNRISCLLVKSAVLLDYYCPEPSFREAWYLFIAKINRKGYSLALSNCVYQKSIIPARIETDELDDVLSFLASQGFHEAPHYKSNGQQHLEERRIRLLQAALQPNTECLIDCTCMPALYNGTSKLMLSYLDGLLCEHLDFARYTILINKEAMDFFSLEEKYPSICFVTELNDCYFKIGLRLNQPWRVDECYSLASHAYFNYYVMYDTITYDCYYLRTQEVRRTWEFAANHADGIISISQFTRDHFKRRFPAYMLTAPAHLVARPSLCVKDYVTKFKRTFFKRKQCKHILVVGNDSSHKNLHEIASIFPARFPQLEFNILGLEGSAQTENISYMPPTGKIDNDTVEGLYDWADIVIYPSSFEGFGLPVMQSLARGKCVFVRNSVLNEECLALYSGPGRVVFFDSFEQLNQRLNAYISRIQHKQAALPFEKSFSFGLSTYDNKAMVQLVVDFINQHNKLGDGQAFRQRMALVAADQQ